MAGVVQALEVWAIPAPEAKVVVAEEESGAVPVGVIEASNQQTRSFPSRTEKLTVALPRGSWFRHVVGVEQTSLTPIGALAWSNEYRNRFSSHYAARKSRQQRV
jgi:hypothetical protein